MTDEPQPWERRPGEPARHYDAFRHYRDLPAAERTLDAVADHYGVKATTVRSWSAAWLWVDRAEAWDAHVHRAIDDERLATLTEMYNRHVQVGKIAVGKALEALRNLTADRIPAGAAARLLELGVRIEREMLSITPEELMGDVAAGADDPWEALARELAIPAN